MANNEIFFVLKHLKIVGCDHCCLLSSSYKLLYSKVHLMLKTHSGDQDYSVVLCRFPVLKAETMRWLMNSLIGWTFFVINPAKITKKGKN